MQTLPLFARLQNRPCLVVGGGAVATRRVEQLLGAGARVTVIAPTLSPEIEAWSAGGRIDAVVGEFAEEIAGARIENFWLLVAATDDPEVNRSVAAAAEQARRFCNVVDTPELCSFIMPTIIDRAPVTIAISSAGQSPVLARWIKGLIEETLPSGVGTLASLAGRWRARIKAALPNLDERRRFWQQALSGPVADLAYAGREAESEAALEAALAAWSRAATGPARIGQAYLVGAGPGDPDLITLRGRKLLARADAVLYDRLVNPKILEFARRDAELVCVGKAAGRLSIRQEQLNRLLVSLVGAGKHVCRLKGGDPMVFGRVAEELEALTEAGLPYQIVPGVSAVEGCAAYAGIPLTMRDEARAVLIATGHTTDHTAADLAAYRPDQTLALYMAIAHFDAIAGRLLELGHPRRLPVAVIENGTTARQRVIVATLEDLPRLAAEHAIESPALLLVGNTVRYAQRYAWFNPRAVTVDVQQDLARVIG